MAGFRYFVLLVCLLPPLTGLTAAGQETFYLVCLREQSKHQKQPASGVLVGEVDLSVVSSSVMAAETWLRDHVLAHYPSTRITTIVVGRGILCNKSHENQWDSVLPSVKNLYYSLVRWGMVKEIKVSAAFSSDCLTQSSQVTLKPLLSFLHDTKSAYAIDQVSQVSSYHKVLVSLGLSKLRDIRVIRGSRKLSSVSYSSPLEPEGLQVPSHLARKPASSAYMIPHPPPPDASYSFPPDSSPALAPPASPPVDYSGFPLPPCMPAPVVSLPAPTAPAPASGEGHRVGLWCVAKPTVPLEKLQEALDYACGEGGADCEEIGPNGRCYYPDNVVAHASYAFNSYWQKMKKNGGSCNFDGTAVLINSDPSFLQCHYELS